MSRERRLDACSCASSLLSLLIYDETFCQRVIPSMNISGSLVFHDDNDHLPLPWLPQHLPIPGAHARHMTESTWVVDDDIV